MTSIAAIPPPSAFVRSSAPSGSLKLRQMLESDAIAVRPIQPIPDEERRLRDPKVGETQQPSEETVRRGSGASGDASRSRSLASATETGGSGAGSGVDANAGTGTATPPPARQPTAAGPSTGFLTQSLAQETIGSGLYIEPWAAALGAYRRAAAGPRESLVSSVSV